MKFNFNDKGSMCIYMIFELMFKYLLKSIVVLCVTLYYSNKLSNF